MEVEGVTVKLVGARLGARRKVSTWMMKPTIYLLYIVRALQIVRRKHKRKKERALNRKKKKKQQQQQQQQELNSFYQCWELKTLRKTRFS